MLSGKLPTGTVGDPSDGDGPSVGRGRERVRAGERARSRTAAASERPETAPADAGRAERTVQAKSPDAGRRDPNRARLESRPERDLTVERAECQEMIARYERLLAEAQTDGIEGSGGDAGTDTDAVRRAVATVRRALTRLRLRVPSRSGRSRSRRE